MPHPHHTTGGGRGKISYGASIWDPSHGGGGEGGVAGPGAYIYIYTHTHIISQYDITQILRDNYIQWDFGALYFQTRLSDVVCILKHGDAGDI